MTIEHIPGNLSQGLEEQRRELIAQIRHIYLEYEKAIEPYRKKLVQIEMMRGPGTLLVTGDDMKNFNFDLACRELDERDAKRKFGEGDE